MHSTLSLRSFLNIAFEMMPMFIWLTMVLSRPFREDRLALPLSHLSPPGDQWCDVLGFVLTGSVSSSSTLQVFREAISHLWGWLDPPVYLLSHSPSLHHVWGGTPTGVFKGGRWPIDTFQSGLPIPFFFFFTDLLPKHRCFINCLCTWWLLNKALVFPSSQQLAVCSNLPPALLTLGGRERKKKSQEASVKRIKRTDNGNRMNEW